MQLRGVDSLVLARMDGTSNEHARIKFDGFPKSIFYPARNKSFDPITFDDDCTVKGFYKFLKKNTAIAFELPKKSTPGNVEATPVTQDRSATEKIFEKRGHYT